MFQAPLCPSSGAQEYYTVVAACGISCCGFQVAGLVWSLGLCVRFAGCCRICALCGECCLTASQATFSTQCTHIATRFSSITTATTGQTTIGSGRQMDLLMIDIKMPETF